MSHAACPGRKNVLLHEDPCAKARIYCSNFGCADLSNWSHPLRCPQRIDNPSYSFLAMLQELPGADWKKGLEAGQRVRARIIYVDSAAKRVCLSLLPHLVAASTESLSLPPINTLFEVLLPAAQPPLDIHALLCVCLVSQSSPLLPAG